MIEILLILIASLLGWFFARRQKPTEPPVTPPKRTEPPKFEDKIDEITKVDPYPGSDSDLATWLDDHFKGKRK